MTIRQKPFGSALSGKDLRVGEAGIRAVQQMPPARRSEWNPWESVHLTSKKNNTTKHTMEKKPNTNHVRVYDFGTKKVTEIPTAELAPGYIRATSTAYKAAVFERCVFRNAKLVKVDFQTSTFTDCQFEGELRDVLFYRRGFQGEAFPPNEMINVDFSRAQLRAVGFRGLTMDRVKLPHDANHIVIRNFASALDRMIAIFKQQQDNTAKMLVAFLNIYRKWAVPDQKQGVINAQDLAEAVGEDAVERLLAAVPK